MSNTIKPTTHGKAQHGHRYTVRVWEKTRRERKTVEVSKVRVEHKNFDLEEKKN